jgi:hypothetical protein
MKLALKNSSVFGRPTDIYLIDSFEKNSATNLYHSATKIHNIMLVRKLVINTPNNAY